MFFYIRYCTRSLILRRCCPLRTRARSRWLPPPLRPVPPAALLGREHRDRCAAIRLHAVLLNQPPVAQLLLGAVVHGDVKGSFGGAALLQHIRTCEGQYNAEAGRPRSENGRARSGRGWARSDKGRARLDDGRARSATVGQRSGAVGQRSGAVEQRSARSAKGVACVLQRTIYFR